MNRRRSFLPFVVVAALLFAVSCSRADHEESGTEHPEEEHPEHEERGEGVVELTPEAASNAGIPWPNPSATRITAVAPFRAIAQPSPQTFSPLQGIMTTPHWRISLLAAPLRGRVRE